MYNLDLNFERKNKIENLEQFSFLLLHEKGIWIRFRSVFIAVARSAFPWVKTVNANTDLQNQEYGSATREKSNISSKRKRLNEKCIGNENQMFTKCEWTSGTLKSEYDDQIYSFWANQNNLFYYTKIQVFTSQSSMNTDEDTGPVSITESLITS